jgi:hypothetical protein
MGAGRSLVLWLRRRRDESRKKRLRANRIAREVHDHRRGGQNELSKYEGPPNP